MGRADFAVVAVGAVIGYVLVVVIMKLVEDSRERHVQKLIQTTPWRHFLDVGDEGQYIIGLWREAEGHVFGRFELATLPGNTAALDVQLKLSEAKDRAIIYNNGPTDQR